jgi:phosphoglycolate phosphatase
MSNRLAIFDCDGTLIDSQHVIIEAMTRCFEEASLLPPLERDIRRIVGLSLEKAIAHLAPHLPNAKHYALADGYRKCFRAMRAKGTLHEPLYAGIADAIDTLDAAGWLLGVATGKSDRGLVSCLQSHSLLPKFISLQTADRHPSKPHPSMAFAAMADAGAKLASMQLV